MKKLTHCLCCEAKLVPMLKKETTVLVARCPKCGSEYSDVKMEALVMDTTAGEVVPTCQS